MLRTEFNIKKLKFDRARYAARYREVGLEVLHDAARVWLEAVLNISYSGPGGPNFPVATGMAKASLRPLGRILNEAISIYTAAGRKSRISEGESLGHAKIYATGNQYGPSGFFFEWSSEVPHWTDDPALEYNANPRGGWPAWEAQQAGNEAFRNFFFPELERRLPKLTDYIGLEE